VPKPDCAVRPPPLCEAISETDYARYIETADEQVCRWSLQTITLQSFISLSYSQLSSVSYTQKALFVKTVNNGLR